MVASAELSPPKPSHGVLYLLQKSGLMTNVLSLAGAAMKITSRGFQFLLCAPHAQLWELLLHYLSMTEVRVVQLVSARWRTYLTRT